MPLAFEAVIACYQANESLNLVAALCRAGNILQDTPVFLRLQLDNGLPVREGVVDPAGSFLGIVASL